MNECISPQNWPVLEGVGVREVIYLKNEWNYPDERWSFKREYSTETKQQVQRPSGR